MLIKSNNLLYKKMVLMQLSIIKLLLLILLKFQFQYNQKQKVY